MFALISFTHESKPRKPAMTQSESDMLIQRATLAVADAAQAKAERHNPYVANPDWPACPSGGIPHPADGGCSWCGVHTDGCRCRGCWD